MKRAPTAGVFELDWVMMTWALAIAVDWGGELRAARRAASKDGPALAHLLLSRLG